MLDESIGFCVWWFGLVWWVFLFVLGFFFCLFCISNVVNATTCENLTLATEVKMPEFANEGGGGNVSF